jgi:hypothetical protein
MFKNRGSMVLHSYFGNCNYLWCLVFPAAMLFAPSKHKFEHPRFCFERLEYVDSGTVLVKLSAFCYYPVSHELCWSPEASLWPGSCDGREAAHLMKHLDAPGRWLGEKHRRMLMNKLLGMWSHLSRISGSGPDLRIGLIRDAPWSGASAVRGSGPPSRSAI